MNGVQTRFKCKLDVKRCKRFVFPPSSLLPRSNALKTKAIRYFQTDQTLTRIVSSPLVVTTTGSEFDAYRSGGRNRFTVDELLRPYQGGAVHAGMVWQTPFVVYGMGTPDAEKNIALAADLYKKRVMALIGKNKSEDSW